jgi:hypothetical protein
VTLRDIGVEQFRSLYRGITNSFDHLEMRDSYGTAVEIPQIARWKAGEPDDFSWLGDWCDLMRRFRDEGKRCRRAKVVSLPLSEYQRWNYSVLAPIVASGEQIRWADRRAVSCLALPPSDFYLLDDKTVMFLHFTGDGQANGYTVTEDPDVVELCRTAFQAVWNLSTPHDEFRPESR